MIKVLAVCGSGMGTSMMMKMNVNSVLKKLGVDGTADSCAIAEANAKASSFDVVVASTHIVKELESKVGSKTKLVGLQNIMNKKELEEKLKEVL